MKKTLLVIGDLTLDGSKPALSMNRFIEHKKHIQQRGLHFEIVNYEDVFSGRLPTVSTRRLKIMLFFPYTYWNTNIERYTKDNRVYGDDNFGKDYTEFFRQVALLVRHKYKNKLIEYVNPPKSCVLDRDKRKTNFKLNQAGILTPKIYKLRSINKLYHLLDRHNLYVKPPFGSMGKGISYITKDNCITNFIFEKGNIISRAYDYNWDFIEIPKSQRDAFIKVLIKHQFIFEEAIKTPVVRRRKFDLRVYPLYQDVPYFYARSTPFKRIITNWSQGGRIEKKSFLQKVLPKSKLYEMLALSIKAAKVLGINFAGIDVLFDKDFEKIYILEAHSFPGYEHGFDLMNFLAKKI